MWEAEGDRESLQSARWVCQLWKEKRKDAELCGKGSRLQYILRRFWRAQWHSLVQIAHSIPYGPEMKSPCTATAQSLAETPQEMSDRYWNMTDSRTAIAGGSQLPVLTLCGRFPTEGRTEQNAPMSATPPGSPFFSKPLQNVNDRVKIMGFLSVSCTLRVWSGKAVFLPRSHISLCVSLAQETSRKLLQELFSPHTF